jgi:c-di-GMP-binding flagellar brake protein YcgR
MTNTAARASILLVDDGELDAVAALLESQGRPFQRLRGAQIPAEIAPPSDLLIVTPRRVERVRRGSPEEAAPGLPLRIIAVDEDSPAMRRRLRRTGLHLLVRLPADDEIWRLLIARAVYHGDERREDLRVTVGSPVAVTDSVTRRSADPTLTTLIDLSNRGCRLHTTEIFSVGDPLAFTLSPSDEEPMADGGPLMLRGRVRRIVPEAETGGQMIAMTFDTDLPQTSRTRLTSLINRWASGPHSFTGPDRRDAPTIPPCQLPSIPDLMLDDETDPPVRGRGDLPIELDTERERRVETRGQFESSVLAESPGGPVVLIGRDLSAGGMRVEAIGELRLADRFRLALHGPEPTEPLIVHAEVVRDDGREGFALAFRDVDAHAARQIEKLVACLPDVESLEDDELGGFGAILSELMPD